MNQNNIKPQELRLTNRVEQGEIIEIKQRTVRVRYELDGKERTSLILHEDLKPIPLSEEVLLRCGFEKVEVEIEDYYSCTYEKQLNSDVFISYADDFSCTLNWNKEESINGFGAIPNWHSVDTLHGLQNLTYALTGEELEVRWT